MTSSVEPVGLILKAENNDDGRLRTFLIDPEVNLAERVHADSYDRQSLRQSSQNEFRIGYQGIDDAPFLPRLKFEINASPVETTLGSGLITLTDLDTIVVGSAAATSFSVTTGYVIWLLRGGTLITSMMSSIPLWQRFDPLQVINGDDSVDPSSTESLADLVESSGQTHDG